MELTADPRDAPAFGAAVQHFSNGRQGAVHYVLRRLRRSAIS